MGSRAQVNKALQDIEDCVSELKRQSVDGRNPINDDSSTLHRFQEKIELILLLGLTEKPGFLGPKKSYWNYICTCFTSLKRRHDGINFVKSVIALKTPLGRGRAFIRFCLTQKCLADTLQSCFMEENISRDFYAEHSLPVQRELWSTLVTSLYELNELNFDLYSGHTELDMSWPKFAKKYFTSADENVHSRNRSTPNLNSIASEGNLDSFKLIGLNEELSQKNECLQKEVKCLEEEKLKLQCDIETLQKKFLCLQQQLNSCKDRGGTEFDKVLSTVSDESTSSSQAAAEVTGDDSTVKVVERVNENLFDKCGENHDANFLSPSEGSKIKSDVPGKYPDCKLPQNGHEILEQQALNFPVTCSTVDRESKETFQSKDMPISTSHIADDFLPVKVVERTSENVLERCEENDPSVRSKIKNDSSGKYPDCDLPQNVHETLKYSATCDEKFQSKDICMPQCSIYISELLLGIKTVIDDLECTVEKSNNTLLIPHISRLKKNRNYLEDRFSSQIDKSKNSLNLTDLVEKFISYIKDYTNKQEIVMNSLQEKIDTSLKANHNLYSKIRTLKDLLRSYGFLKVSGEKENHPENILSPLDAPSSKSHVEDFSFGAVNDPPLKRIIVPLLPILNSSFRKLNNLNEKMNELQFGLDSSQELNNNLITRVQDQEMHLKGVTKEIEEAQQLVSVLKRQHRKLQSAEGILKYDLQEKRKLLTRLKQQLENTREDFNLVRIKNSKSEADWQDLRKEFVERHKQTSEESGFIDDKNLEEHETVFPNCACDCSFPREDTPEKVVFNKDLMEVSQDVPPKRKRLELLEQQCQNLYSNLLQSSKRREEIDKRLENMCKTIEKNNEMIHPNGFSAESNENATSTVIQTPSGDSHQSVTGTPDIFPSSPYSSSDVGSLNSECSSGMPGMSNDSNSSESFLCDSFKTSFSSNLLLDCIHPISSASQQTNGTTTFSDSHLNSACSSDSSDAISCESVELNAKSVQNSNVESISHVDSLLIKKKDLEESLKILEINEGNNGIDCSEQKNFPQSEELSAQISSSQDEERNLVSKIQEFERRILILSTELEQTTQQLILSKASKEHEVAALQFQLNTQALNYERSLKEFTEQSKGLEDLKQRVTEQEQLIRTLEQALSEMHSDRENEKEHQWQELEDIHTALEVREQECISLCQELQKSMSEVEQEHNKNKVLVSQLTYNQRDKEGMEAEILMLKQYSRELQKKLVKLLKEKDILWKRNSNFHHLQKIKINDRWINDSEVSRCLGCKTAFSFMLRKHHCRLCGRIYCYSCSNNWLSTASSSKKIRTCNECFVQHLEIKKVVRRGSEIPLVEDDSEDETENGYLPRIPASSSSFTSEIPSSMTDSIISLPITQKQSTPCFASAPDLRYVFKPDNISILHTEENFNDEIEKKTVVNDDGSNSSEVISDECTSVTLEEDMPKIYRLKEISIDEVKSHQYGLSGKFIINPQERDDLPIICHACPVVLQWSFTCNFHNIPLTMTHEDEECKNSQTIFHQALNKMDDQMELNLPGCYVFQFDNTARDKEMEVSYILYIKH